MGQWWAKITIMLCELANLVLVVVVVVVTYSLELKTVEICYFYMHGVNTKYYESIHGVKSFEKKFNQKEKIMKANLFFKYVSISKQTLNLLASLSLLVTSITCLLLSCSWVSSCLTTVES